MSTWLISSLNDPDFGLWLSEDEHKLKFVMEILRHTYLLPEHADLIPIVLNCYKSWVTGERKTPLMVANIQNMMQLMMDHVFPAFSMLKRTNLCESVIDLYQLMASECWSCLRANVSSTKKQIVL